MAVLSYNEILPKTIINYNNEPFEVLSSRLTPGCAESAIVNGLLDGINSTGKR